jgi:hypothetical protein
MPTLETANDRQLEQLATDRYVSLFGVPVQVINTRQFAYVDKLLTYKNELVGAFEIKTRKQSAATIRRYPEGLLIKHRKLQEMRQFSEMMRVPAVIVFAFENAAGEIWECNTETLPELEQHTPKPRNNFRNLACDLEPVAYLQWDQHLRQVA